MNTSSLINTQLIDELERELLRGPKINIVAKLNDERELKDADEVYTEVLYKCITNRKTKNLTIKNKNYKPQNLESNQSKSEVPEYVKRDKLIIFPEIMRNFLLEAFDHFSEFLTSKENSIVTLAKDPLNNVTDEKLIYIADNLYKRISAES